MKNRKKQLMNASRAEITVHANTQRILSKLNVQSVILLYVSEV
jgi:hypothetical protein